MILERAAILLRPSVKTTPDEWARKNRTYPKTSGIPGPRDPSLTPYIIPIERAVASRKYRRVTAVMSAQSGKTEGELDVMGHAADQRPTPILFVGPNLKFLNEQFEPRLMQLLDEAPMLMRKVSRGKRMTKTRKIVAGVPIRLAHGGSSTALKSDPAGLVIIDEYDELLADVRGQGDPLGLVEARGYTYAGQFTVMVSSTPSVGTVDLEHDENSGLDFWKLEPENESVQSPIWKLWQQGTRYHWTWKCPHCAKWFVPRFRLLKWPKDAIPSQAQRTAFMLCGHEDCGGIIEEKHKAAMNAAGVYVAPGQWIDEHGVVQGEPPDSRNASFWVSGLASPFASFGERASEFLTAVESGEGAKIQTAINAAFGELYAPAGGEAPEWAEVAKLKLPYHYGDLPTGVIIITAGVDVQKNSLIYVVRGWGARGTSWLLDHGQLMGPTDEQDVWMVLSDLLDNRRWGELRIHLALIDSGYRPDKAERGPEHAVYEFCRRHQRIAKPSKGSESITGVPVKISPLEVTPKGKGAPYSIGLARINTDWAKLWVHERIRWPQDQPGAFHISEDTSDQYCRELVSEARVAKPSGRATWVRKFRDNHAFDCEVMAYAAGYLLNAQRIPEGYKLQSQPQPQPQPVVPPKPKAESWMGPQQDWFGR